MNLHESPSKKRFTISKDLVVYRIKGVICIQRGDIKSENTRIYLSDEEANDALLAIAQSIDGRKL